MIKSYTNLCGESQISTLESNGATKKFLYIHIGKYAQQVRTLPSSKIDLKIKANDGRTAFQIIGSFRMDRYIFKKKLSARDHSYIT